MELHIKNNQLAEFINLLYKLKLKGKQSRHRSKLLKSLGEQLAARNESEAALRKEHCKLDDNGEPKTVETEQGVMWDILNKDAFTNDLVELMNEEIVICDPNNEETIRTVADALFTCEEEFSEMEAATYDTLCELFEQALEM